MAITILGLIILSLLFGSVRPDSLLRKGATLHSRSASQMNAWWDESTAEESLIINVKHYQVKDMSQHKVYRKMYIHNQSNEDTTFTIKPKFWNKAISDEGLIDVSLVFPGNVLVGAGTERTVSIVFQIRNDFMSRNVSLLGDYDGYLDIDGGRDVFHLPWLFASHTMDELGGLPQTTNVKQTYRNTISAVFLDILSASV
eukprot:CAMPEP_0202484224 /NCGR_PEP_ID=MMETSP1361-20130828/3339_1 /ASSEMBLY_ACC=CAM_ASM_000849 /TAXON_ID=210615 /ORGANISM="Staurosira complex sp., Strain CCMP2646" /LENGTH=198 /DNA_ID=CAMNT_0049112795 /DNA_START=171 /DNA_END=764 /DNA_ORIENTATION=-